MPYVAVLRHETFRSFRSISIDCSLTTVWVYRTIGTIGLAIVAAFVATGSGSVTSIALWSAPLLFLVLHFEIYLLYRWARMKRSPNRAWRYEIGESGIRIAGEGFESDLAWSGFSVRKVRASDWRFKIASTDQKFSIPRRLYSPEDADMIDQLVQGVVLIDLTKPST